MKKEIDSNAYFGIFYENGEDNSYIKANKDGLKTFIDELNKSLNDFDFHLSKEDHFALINLNKDEWYDRNSHIRIDWIEPTRKSREGILGAAKATLKAKWYNGAVSFLMKLLSFFLISSFLIGVFTSLKWLIQVIF
jgi:hypothetical protein